MVPLGDAVQHALVELRRAFRAHPGNAGLELRDDDALVRLVFRLVVLLVAEERRLLDVGGAWDHRRGAGLPALGGLFAPGVFDTARLDEGVLRSVLARLSDAARGPEDLGAAYEGVLDGTRKASGSFYTPATLVRHVLDAALPSGRDLAVLDPACGAGHFLIAAARRLSARRVYGVDLDATAVELCRAALWMEAGEPGLPIRAFDANIRVGNALLGAPAHLGTRSAADAWCAERARGPHRFVHWHLEFPEVHARGGFDAVVGNPPYLNQLETGSAVDEEVRRLLGAVFGDVKRAYTDLATLFLVLGERLLRPGGRVALVLPLSFFAAKDAAPARHRVGESSSLRSIWLTDEQMFPSASVFVSTVCLEKAGRREARVVRHRGNAFVPAEPLDVDMDALAAEPTWGGLIADLVGVPRMDLRGSGQLGDLATTTADFRDQFYGLVPFVVEDGPATRDDGAFPPLVVTGLVEPAACLWGERSCRFGKRKWERPRVDLARLPRPIATWARARLTPRIVVATQTRVLEAFVDMGRTLNTVPTITVVPARKADLWRLLAVLLSPPVTAWALGRYAGVAMSVDAIKLSARQVGLVPLPTDRAPWERAARLVEQASSDPASRRAHLVAAAALMCDAYEVEREPVSSWWAGRW